jgi:hypothetical protein
MYRKPARGLFIRPAFYPLVSFGLTEPFPWMPCLNEFHLLLALLSTGRVSLQRDLANV